MRLIDGGNTWGSGTTDGVLDTIRRELKLCVSKNRGSEGTWLIVRRALLW